MVQYSMPVVLGPDYVLCIYFNLTLSHSRNKKSRRIDGDIILQFQVDSAPSNELALCQSIQNTMDQTSGLTRPYPYFNIIETQPHVSELAIKVANVYACHPHL